MRDQWIDLLREAFVPHEEFAAVYLFGSVARGTFGPASDLDIAVLEKQRPASTLATSLTILADTLCAQVGRRVELVSLHRSSLDLIHRVLRDGILLSEHDRSCRVRFEVAKRREYLDLKPYLDKYRKPRTHA